MDIKTKNKLLKILKYAQEHTEFYGDLLKEKRITIDNVEEVFLDLDFMKKPLIKENYSKIISEKLKCNELSDIWNFANRNFGKDYTYNLNGEIITAEYTSGTTGSPLVVVKSELERLILGKTLWNFRSKFGNSNAKKMFQFIHNGSGLSPFQFYSDDYFKQKEEELKYLSSSEYNWWHIFPSMLEGYAYIAKTQGIRLDNLFGIESNGAYISNEEKRRYEQVFHCKIVNNYGCKEIWNIGYENLSGTLSISPDILLELVDENGNIITDYNKEGYVVVTSLVLKSMPFIRYYLGDLAKYVKTIKEDGTEEKCLEVLPGRYKISGTEEYGNRFFREITIDLIQKYNMKMIQSVFVTEKEHNKLDIIISGCNECQEDFKNNFLDCLKNYQRVNSDEWRINFIFNEKTTQKSMFVSLVR